MANHIPQISDAEWTVMKVLWAKSPLRSVEIMAALAPVKDWHPNTVKTLLSRLQKKKAVGIEQEMNRYLFFPLVSEAECVKAESQSFMERVFGGSVKPLLVHFVEKNKVSPNDIDELKSLLRKKKR